MGKRGRKPLDWREHFKKRIRKQGDHWLWTGKITSNGSPSFSSITAPTSSAFALSIFLAEGVLPDYPVYSACGVQKCVRPDHLSKKMAPNLARDEEIRKRWARSLKYGVTFESIGNEYKVTKQRIEQICRGISEHDSDI